MKLSLRVSILSIATAASIFIALPAFAQTTVSTPVRPSATARPSAISRGTTATSTAARLAFMKNRDNTEITSRISALNNLSSRIGSMKNLSDSEKASLSSDMQSEIGNLTSLQSNISVATSAPEVGTYSKSITQAYRIYALVVPQGSIAAAADRINTLVASFNAIISKIQMRVSSLSTSNPNASAINLALSDLTAKVFDAGTQATAATSEVANLARQRRPIDFDVE